jgi:hypothetical protein
MLVGLIALMFAMFFANVFAVHLFESPRNISHRRQFEGEDSNQIDYKRIERMIQIALESETKKLVRDIGADIGKQILETTKEGLKEMMSTADVLRRMSTEKVEAKSVVECSCPTIPVDTRKVSEESAPLFPSERLADYVVAMARVPKDSFAETFAKQLGVPFEPSTNKQHDIILLYDKLDGMPSNKSSFYSPQQTRKIVDTIPLFQSAKEATENCDQLNVILTQADNNRRQCVAIVPQYESFYVQKLMRLAIKQDQAGKSIAVADLSVPLQYVSRFQRLGNPDQIYPLPKKEATRAHWGMLQKYFGAVDIALEELEKILAKIAIDNTVVVMVSNFGHSVMLSNFICSAKSRNLDISNAIVFATDQETADLATSFGVAAYYDKGVRFKVAAPRSTFRRSLTHTFVLLRVAVTFLNGNATLCHWFVGVSVGYHMVCMDISDSRTIRRAPRNRSVITHSG